MRVLTVALIALLMAAGIIPAVAADGQPDPDVSASTSPSPTSSTPPPPPPVSSATFNYPRVGAPDPAINDELVRLIDAVAPGATISAAFFVIQPHYPVVEALMRAHGRGANVRVVLDSGDAQPAATAQSMRETFERLSAVTGSDPAAASFTLRCVLACISKDPDSINHNKFVAMSASGDRSDVVFQSTANIRSDGSGDAAWNAAVVTSGNPGLYAAYTRYLGNLAARLNVPDADYNAVQPPVSLGASTPYYFPRTDGKDSVSVALGEVDCARTPTKVDVMASFFTRPKVRNRLNELAQAGCQVRVIARTDTITREFCDSLQAPIAVRISDKPSGTTVGIHGKYLTIAGSFGRQTDAHVVWMGSHNLTRSALVRNDETFLMTDDRDLHAAFAQNFDTIWGDPTLTAGCSRAGATDSEQVEEEANSEVTPLIKSHQKVDRALPRKLRLRTELMSTRTVQGQPVSYVAKCRVKGTGQRLKPRAKCVIKRPKKAPALVLSGPKGKRLKVRLEQTAPGSPLLEPFARAKDYAYRFKKR